MRTGFGKGERRYGEKQHQEVVEFHELNLDFTDLSIDGRPPIVYRLDWSSTSTNVLSVCLLPVLLALSCQTQLSSGFLFQEPKFLSLPTTSQQENRNQSFSFHRELIIVYPSFSPEPGRTGWSKTLIIRYEKEIESVSTQRKAGKKSTSLISDQPGYDRRPPTFWLISIVFIFMGLAK